ncbi:MAG: hypothetical protein IT240_03605 [Bacteroidia bacterium]|nr:hypothetical protein [Bacteroidia bacterium]
MNRLEPIIQKRPWLFAGSLNLILFSSLFLFCEIRYETNDDFFMNSIVSGYSGGMPDAHLPYTHFFIGLALSGLYKLSTALNWYALYLLLTHFISWLILFRCFAAKKAPLYPLLALSGLFIALEPVFFTNLQFTTSATLAALAGMCLIHFAFTTNQLRRKTLFAGMALVLFAAMIRESSAIMAILFCMLTFVNFRNMKAMLPPLLVAGLLLAFIWGLQFANRLYFEQSPEWSAYYHNVKSGNRFNDNPAFYNKVVNVNMNVRAINGWSQNDLNLFGAFFRNYEPVYNIEAYDKLYKSYASFSPLPLRDFIYSFRTGFGLPFVLFILLYAFFNAQKDEKLRLLLQGILLLVLAWYIYAALQMKERALLSMLMAFCIGVLLIPDGQNLSGKLRLVSGLFIAGILLSGMMYQHGKRAAISTKTQKERTISAGILKQMQQHPAKWMVWGPALPTESLNPLKYSFHYQDNHPEIYPIVIFNKSPLYQQASGKTFEQLLVDSNTRVLSMTDNWVTFTPERLDTFYREHLHCTLIAGGDSTDQLSGRRIFWFKGCMPNQTP